MGPVAAIIRAPVSAMMRALDRQRGRLILWVPVFLGLGIALYFRWPGEPRTVVLALLGLTGLPLLAWSVLRPSRIGPALGAPALVALGFALAGLSAHWVAAPKIGFRYYGPIQGRIVAIDRSQSDRQRLTLDRVVLADMAPARTPARIRISLHGDQAQFTARPGATLITTGHLSPPAGPVEPGGFDFMRHAWFLRLGAVGYTRNPVLTLFPPDPAGGLGVLRLRLGISDYVRRAMPGRAGGIAAALITGDRSALDQPTVQTLRDSNLAHLLAISGLHMGLLTGVVLVFLRALLALWPRVALCLPTRKIAAAAALAAAAGYLLLSGATVATERAFVMVAVMLIAVLMDRRAISLWAVALAAIIVLVLRPVALLGPGFQMSFAATTALVFVFGLFRRGGPFGGAFTGALPRPLRPVLSLVLSSLVAGLATAPFAAAHFNQFAQYGLLANLASVPVMGMIVVPGAVAAAVLWPVGLDGIGFALMKRGINWILWVAEGVAGLDGAVAKVPQPPGIVLGMIALGALFAMLWQGRARWLGGLGLLAAAMVWGMAERPAILISEGGALIGVMTAEGRALNKPRGQGFTALAWLENDGDRADQELAFARASGLTADRVTRIRQGGQVIWHLSGRRAARQIAAACRAADLVITDQPHPPIAGCRLIDGRAAQDMGAFTVTPSPGGLNLTPSRDPQYRRLWQ